MRYVAAYLLANLGGNTSPSAGDIKKILDSVGVSVDDAKLEKVISELKDKDINEVIAKGKEKLATVPIGSVAMSGGAASTGGAAEAPKKEEKKEEAKKESSESESDDDLPWDIFDN